MKKTFIETSAFTAEIQNRLDDETYALLQNELMAHPDIGKAMPGCGGLRKLRIADPRRQKGKRGGARIIYLHVPEVDWIFFVDIYSKSEKDDLSAAEKKMLKRLAEEFKRQALSAAGKSKRESIP